MLHEVKGRWNGAAAEKMYKGPLRCALEKAYPSVRGPWRVLEDSDPTGYKSCRGKAGKADVGIEAFALPKCSPDLNSLDFSFWAEVNKRMRQQEKNWPKSAWSSVRGERLPAQLRGALCAVAFSRRTMIFESRQARLLVRRDK